MCGIALSLGPEADPTTFRRMLATLSPRGEVTETRYENGLLTGVRRLPVLDAARAAQPWAAADERWLLCCDGEVFNHRELRAELTRRGHRFRGASDAEVVLAAFLQWGEGMVRRLRGEYALAVVERATGRAYLVRDPLGVKPLYWARTPGCLHLASEVKALVGHRAPIAEVPPGHHGWAEPDGSVRLRGYVDLRTLGEGLPVVDDPDEAALLVRVALADSVRMRVDTDRTVGVVLSGGLDSSLALLYARELHPDCVAVTVGVPDSPDVAYARRLARDLGVPHEVVELRPRDIRLADIREAIRMSELTEYGDIINAVVTVPLFRRLRELGVRVALTGDGSDELFGGYPMYRQVGPEASRRLFLHRLRNLCRTELQRVDRAGMGHGVAARVPFLDLSLVELAMRLPIGLKVRAGQEKWILRRAFADLLPDYVRQRPKNPMSYSSGLHERARLYKPLFARLHRSFGYHLLEPVRRDFDSVLTRCGNDLDRALAAGRERPDHTVLEHARDLVGAARWNAAPVVRRLVRPRPTRRSPAG
ncbi:asparagine synthetase B family protein [Micromonospora sp. CPCC 205561]|uniref:asparagine synthetase B family protein n=1 Tax=Micromonospora sp. CPCC 205561 TaxID=3122407 RepID=UPI002FF061E9